MAAPRDLASAVAQGDIQIVESLLDQGHEPNKRSKDGMTPLSVAGFWGYTEVARKLLKKGADVNAQNIGTGWTPLHCAAFQGHGPVILKLLAYKPDLSVLDSQGRTAVDFASALDSIWPLFAAAGCRRTPPSKLDKLNIDTQLNAIAPEDDDGMEFLPVAYNISSDPDEEFAALTGDVLAGAELEEPGAEVELTGRLAIFER